MQSKIDLSGSRPRSGTWDRNTEKSVKACALRTGTGHSAFLQRYAKMAFIGMVEAKVQYSCELELLFETSTELFDH